MLNIRRDGIQEGVFGEVDVILEGLVFIKQNFQEEISKREKQNFFQSRGEIWVFRQSFDLIWDKVNEKWCVFIYIGEIFDIKDKDIF